MVDKKTIQKLKKQLGKGAKQNEPLKKYTFLKIGGPADLLLMTKNCEEFKHAIKSARKLDVPLTILGQGSNILVSDAGVRGLVLINKTSKVEIAGDERKAVESIKLTPRWESDKKKGTFKYEFEDLDYDELHLPKVKVRMDSGVDLPKVTQYLFDQGITGLQWFAGIPGSIGGAVYNNIHGGTHFLSEVLDGVIVLDKNGKTKTLDIKELGVDYDKSRFQESGEIILQAIFALPKGNVEKARYTAKEWARRKSLQPRNTPGCAFHNLTQKQKEKLDIPTTSTGFVIEHLLKMTSFSVGDAAISYKHHNFIVNKGAATAKDYLDVMKEIYRRAKSELGIDLVPEIFFMGFRKKEVAEFSRPELVNIRKKRNKEIKTVYKNSKKLFKK